LDCIIKGYIMASTISALTSGGGIALSGDTSGALQLQTNNGTTAVTVDASQNVGIGTSSQTQTLEVSSANQAVDSRGNVFFRTNNTQAADIGAQLSLGGLYNASSVYGFAGIAGRKENSTSNNVAGYLQLSTTTSGGALTERMRIDSSGNVLVNNTSTVYGKLTAQAGSFNPGNSDWATNGAALGSFGGYGGGLVMIDGSAGYALYCADSGKDFYIKGNNLGTALTGGVYLNDRGTSWTSASDENVKDIIEPIENAAEKVSTLRAVIGKYKDEEEGKRHPFLIAQDVQAVLPEAVSVMNKGEESECLGLSYTDTIPLLVAAIKEQQAIIEQLKADVEALEGASK
jgi:hypothetical protein